MGRRDWTRETLAAGVRAGDKRALARAISLVENSEPLAYELVRDVYAETGRAFAVGVTGPPGVGKSTLLNALVAHVRGGGKTIGVLSVDPSSPFTHGALLGDRIRLADHFLDPDVFIRSMGTRGHLGGLAETTLQAMLVLDAAGKDVIFLETVGAGQSEVEVIGIADTVLLVLMPGSGDSVQALKAGIMEIPDVIAINKMDHPAAKTMLNEVRSILALDRDRAWRTPIVLTDAVRGENVPELWEQIEGHRAHLESGGELEQRRRRNLAKEVFAVASGRAKLHLERTVGVISVDPSSPFSRGALLGDRIRLSDHFLDSEVFIRSMGTRGHLGGLAEATLQALLVLDAAGKDILFLETVGAGQSEVEVIGAADTVLLVLMPGSGDSVQALKAGIMEIPDVIAINKMDHPAAKTMLNEVRSIVALDRERRWRPPIVLTEALRGENVPQLWGEIESHRAALGRDGQLDERRRRNLAREVFALASLRAKAHLEHAVADDPELRRLLDEVHRRELDPLSAVREIVEKVFKIENAERADAA